MNEPPAHEVSRVVEDLFRRESGRLIAMLTRRFGARHVHLVEDMVQEALVKAMQTWPFTGVPRDPTAWLLRTAQNRALDFVRRSQLWRAKADEIVRLFGEHPPSNTPAATAAFEDEIRDSQLRMMFICCHPGLPREAQVTLTLRLLCGLTESEIAAAFLVSEAAITKRLTRARSFLREQEVSLELPPAGEVRMRLEAVRQALYLLFNEGYKASGGDSLLRSDLCAEALHLATLLVEHPCGNDPITHALVALMHFNAGRFPARLNDAGDLLLLEEQDRSLWDEGHLSAGFIHFNAAARGTTVSRFHVEAAIAGCHCAARDFASTNWVQILDLYDQLLGFDPSPVVALHRAVAVARVRGPDAGLDAWRAIARTEALERYHLYHAIEGQLLLDAGRPGAEACFRRALSLANVPAEQALLRRRIDALQRA